MSPFVSAQAFAPPNSTLVYQVLSPEIVWDFLEGKKTSCTQPPAPLPICRRRAYSPAVSGIQWGTACIQPMFPRTCGDAESDLASGKIPRLVGGEFSAKHARTGALVHFRCSAAAVGWRVPGCIQLWRSSKRNAERRRRCRRCPGAE